MRLIFPFLVPAEWSSNKCQQKEPETLLELEQLHADEPDVQQQTV